jgi:hypothetical protein
MSAHESLTREQIVQGSSDRTFGLVFAVFFLIVGAFPLLRGGPVRMWAFPVAAVFLVAALLFPSVLHPLNRLWTRFGLLLHKVTNPLILGILFYLVFTPFGLVFRMLGKDLLRRRTDPNARSYWIERQPPGPAPETMANQF